MGRARAQQVLKNGSWSLPIFVGRSCFDSSKQFRGHFKRRLRAILGDFGQFWAGLNDFALVLSAFQLRRVSARGEVQGMGQPAQQVLEYLLVWLGPASRNQKGRVGLVSTNFFSCQSGPAIYLQAVQQSKIPSGKHAWSCGSPSSDGFDHDPETLESEKSEQPAT